MSAATFYSTMQLQAKQVETADKLEADVKGAKPIHLIVGDGPNDVKLMCGDFDIAKESFISSITLELKPNHKRLVIEFHDFTAKIDATPTEIIKPPGLTLPKWLPAIHEIELAD